MAPSAYVNQLNALVELENARVEEQKRHGTTAARDRLTPLEDRLARLLETIPIELQREGLALAALQVGLRGRWRGSCHPGELGTALRKLGFQRKRRWRGEVGFQALWFPT